MKVMMNWKEFTGRTSHLILQFMVLTLVGPYMTRLEVLLFYYLLKGNKIMESYAHDFFMYTAVIPSDAC